MSGENESLPKVDIVLTQHDVCCYALVIALTAISLAEARRNDRLHLFACALDEFENGAFDHAVQQARAAAAPVFAGPLAEIEHDFEALRARFRRLLARRPGRA